MFGIYKQRSNKVLSGVLAGVATRFGWDVWKVRGIFAFLAFLPKIQFMALTAYVLLAIFLPTKEEVYIDRYGTGPRKRKDAEKL